MNNKLLGIDLGTAYSCVAVFQDGQVKIIPNDHGNLMTPSYVAFTDDDILIGDAAKNQLARNPDNTVFDMMRLIERKYDDPFIQSYVKHWPFKVINEDRKPKMQVQYKNETKSFTPEEIISILLKKIKDMVELYLDKTVADTVITVPSDFNYSQRQAIKDAGLIAGLNVLRVINAPTAAAIAFDFGLDRRILNEQKFLVFDLGSGTVNVSIILVDKHCLEVRSTAGKNSCFSNQLLKVSFR